MKFKPPFSLYKIQEDFISKAKSTISNNKIGIYSSPTGTGKTMSLLCAVYDFLTPTAPTNTTTRNKAYLDILAPPTTVTSVFYCSRTHSQLNQAINELKKFGNSVNATIIGSRKIFCAHEINKKNCDGEELNEKCAALVEKDGCTFYNNYDASGLGGVMDIEDIGSHGRGHKMCGYFLTRQYSIRCEIVFLPYSLLFSRIGRASAGIDINNAIIIVDEAHNIYETVINLNTATISFSAIKKCRILLEELKNKIRKSDRSGKEDLIYTNISKNGDFRGIGKEGVQTNYLENEELENYRFLKQSDESQNYALHRQNELVKKIGNLILIFKKIERFQRELPLNAEEAVLDVDEFLLRVDLESQNFISVDEFMREAHITHRLGLTGSLKASMSSISSFLLLLTMSDEHGRVFYNSSYARFTPLDPKMYFSDVLACRSLILAGGTMEPVDQLKKLFVERDCDYHAFGTICTNFEALVLSNGPTGRELKINYENRESLANEICLAIRVLSCAVKKGGVLVFLPSRAFLLHIEKMEFDFKKKVFYDDVEFFKTNHKEPSILISILGGKLSEGINFSDNLCRLLLIVGVPYPTMNLEMRERIKYNGCDFATGIAMKTVNQAMGRAMRHKDDFAAMVLMDVRYNSLEDKISPWIRNKIKKLDFEKCFGAIRSFLTKNGS